MADRADIVSELARAEARLAQLDCEREDLLSRLSVLRAELSSRPAAPIITVESSPPSTAPAPTTQAEKVSLFRTLFRGRTDVYPRRWENARSGKSGYSPHCANEWKRDVCRKPKVKCGECPARAFVPVSDQVILEHLQGKLVAGVYPIVEGDRCFFVAADFDDGDWQEDVRVFAEVSRSAGLPVAVERSRSGKGAHAWFFFSDAVPASTARQMASYLLTEAMNRRSAIGMGSYDRLFPNQDTLPRGGFGNLIALPLQRAARSAGNTEFLNDSLRPFPDQWSYLARIPRIAPETAALVAREALRRGRVLGVRYAPMTEDAAPWSRPPSFVRERASIPGPLPASLTVTLGQRVFIAREGLPAALCAEILRLAAFQNPVFFEKQAMRFSTAGIPRVVTCAESGDKYLTLPRGGLGDLEELAAAHGITIDRVDERTAGRPLDVSFRGELSFEQSRAAEALLAHDVGVFVAPPGTGKTVLAAHLIAKRKVNTLVLVHRKPLVDQWVERLTAFLSIERREIGVIGGGKRRPTGGIDVAMIQSLVRKGSVQDVVADYGQVIVDECHHVSAASFERVLSEVKARFVLGLTATPRRRDGHHPIVEMQLGPARYVVDSRKETARRAMAQRLLVRETAFSAEWSRAQGIQALLHRRNAGKTEIRVHDYVDGAVPVLAKMYAKRLRGYRALGFELTEQRPHALPRAHEVEYLA